MKFRNIAILKIKNRRGKFMSFLIALIILLMPILFYTIDIELHDNIQIDGKFDDWSKEPKIMDQTTVNNPNVDIYQYGSSINDKELFVYVDVKGTIFEGNQDIAASKYGADVAHVFIDSDSNPTTGYNISDMGADVMLKVAGCNNDIKQSGHYVFQYERSQDDWNGWEYLSTISANSDEKRLEAKTYITMESEEVDVYFQFMDSTGNIDYSDSMLNPVTGTLSVKSSSMSSDILDANTNTEIQRVEFKALYSDITIESITLSLEGSATDGDISTLSLVSMDGGNNNYNIFTSGIGRFTNGYYTYAFSNPLVIPKNKASTYALMGMISSSAISGHSFGITIKDVGIKQGSVGIEQLNKKLSYLISAPSVIKIDGAFADWSGITPTPDSDVGEISNFNINLQEHRSVIQNGDVYFYLSVAGGMMGGTKIPIDPLYYSSSVTPTQMDSDQDGIPA
jgi:hypothetical protein